MQIHELAAWLREELKEVNAKLDILQAHGSNVDVTLARQAKDIEHHIRRTDLLQERAEQLAADLKPVAEHVQRVRSVAWFVGGTLGVIATLVGIATALGSLVGF